MNVVKKHTHFFPNLEKPPNRPAECCFEASLLFSNIMDQYYPFRILTAADFGNVIPNNTNKITTTG